MRTYLSLVCLCSGRDVRIKSYSNYQRRAGLAKEMYVAQDNMSYIMKVILGKDSRYFFGSTWFLGDAKDFHFGRAKLRHEGFWRVDV